MLPELTRIGPIPIHSYGAMVLLGVLFGLWLLRRGCRARGFDPDAATDRTIWCVLAGVLGGRVFYVVQHWKVDPLFTEQPWLGPFMIWKGGLVLFGGILAGLVCMVVLLRRQKLPVLEYFDLTAPGLAVGIALGRVGCFLNGCCWGKVCEPSFALAVRYGPDSIAGHTFPVHPTQLYSSTAALALAWICWRLNAHRLPPGLTTGLLAVGYAVNRFTVETIRGDHDPAPGTWTISQQISTATLVAGVALIIRTLIQAKARVQPPRSGQATPVG